MQWKGSERDDTANVTVTSGHSAIIGKAPVVRKQAGKGTVILLGTIPSYNDMMRLITDACNSAFIPVGLAEGSLIVVPRCGKSHSGLMILECAGKKGSYKLEHPMRDVLTDKISDGEIEIDPYAVKVLQYID